MRIRLVPSNREFFDDFQGAAANLADCVDQLDKMIADPTSPVAGHEAVKACERRGDEITRSILRRLDESFVTPFDREDIHGLAEALDDIVDDICHVAELIVLMGIHDIIPELHEQTRVLQRMSVELSDLFVRLEDMRNLREPIDNIDRLESEGDAVYRRTLARLFSGQLDTLDVIRWKDIIESMEAALDRVEDVADLVGSILVKHA